MPARPAPAGSRTPTKPLISSSESSEGTPMTAASKTSGWETRASSISAGAAFSPRRRVTSFVAPADDLLGPAEERQGAVGVLPHEVAGAQPAVLGQHRGGLLGHPPVAQHDG